MHASTAACDSGAYELQCALDLDKEGQSVLIRYTPTSGPFDLVSGVLSRLWLDGDYSGATCMGTDLASPMLDSTPPPLPGDGRYYLARGLASCVVAGFGFSSLEPDPRSELLAGPCP